MKILKIGIVLCLCNIVPKGLSTYIASNDVVKLGKIIDMTNSYDTDDEDALRENTIQSAEACKCDNGKCVEKDGKLECACAPGFGLYKFNGKVECKPCNCGKESNCTMDVSFWTTTINCICKVGYKVVKNFCKECDCSANENCTFNEVAVKTCVCDKKFAIKKGICEACDCGGNGKCTFNEGGVKTCACDAKFVNKEGKCEACDCGENGKCAFNEGGDKTCVCNEKFVIKEGICKACDCGANRKCAFNEGVKTCVCDEKFANKEGTCEACDCGGNGKCTFNENGVKTCACDEKFVNKEGKCEECDCGANGNCIFNESGDKTCVCDEKFAIKEGTCEACDCGGNEKCTFNEGGVKTCACDEKFVNKEGKCEDPCTPNPCKWYGTCSIENGSILCTCQEPFYGKFCEKEPCDREPCKNNGSCLLASTLDGLTFHCQCFEPYYGVTCEEERHTCEIHNPCENGGECFEKGRDYFCICKEGLTGKNCTEGEWCVHTGHEACGNVPCVYDSNRNISFCECEHSLLYNMKSKRCEPCYCGDHGTCQSEDGMKTCFCDENYIEKDGICYDPCYPNPCWNFGKCIARKNGNYTCICKEPFIGKICEEQIQPSTTISSTFTTTVTQPSCDCGVKSFDCKVDYRGMKRCYCLPGFAQKGNTCSETCNSDAECLNGGTCERSDYSFFCVCLKNYAGDQCQVNAACNTLRRRCDTMRAVCRQTRDGAVCECPPDKVYRWFSGVCEDICDSRKCLNGKCEITGKSFKCVCDDGFTGFRCEEKITKKEGWTAYMIGSAMLSVAVLLLILVALCLVCVIRRFTKANGIKRDIG